MLPLVALDATGEGPSVLFLHGTPTTWDVLRPLADALPAKRRLLAALPGYGAAPPWPGATTAVATAETIERSLASAGIDRVSVVGFSGGGYHALHLAVRGVVKVDRVVALGAFGELSAEERVGTTGLATAVRAGSNVAGIPTQRFLSPAFAAAHPDACARVEAWLRATTPANLATELDALAAAPSLLAKLAGFEGTVLARTGSLDAASPPVHAEAVARACSRGTLQIVDGCGHALLEEDRDATVSAVVAALG
jgi:3-oxoadipate enol-lactonase